MLARSKASALTPLPLPFAGADVITTNTFACTEWSLARIGKQDRQVGPVPAQQSATSATKVPPQQRAAQLSGSKNKAGGLGVLGLADALQNLGNGRPPAFAPTLFLLSSLRASLLPCPSPL